MTLVERLAEFLLARIDEDAERAHVEMTLRDGDPYYDDPGEASSYERWFDPPRVLAECEAKRRIVGLHSDPGHVELCAGEPAGWGGIRWNDALGEEETFDESWCDTLAAITLPYADHPDCDEAWRQR